MIVYGHNHFLIRKVKPEEIGIHSPEFKGLSFELRQQYYHLYFIPTIPKGCEWLLRQNNELYHVSKEIETKLEARFPSSVNWKAFALPILLLIGFALFFITDKFQRNEYRKNDMAKNQENIVLIKSQIKNLDKFSYLVFNVKYDQEIYKISSITKDSLEVIEYKKPLPNAEQFIYNARDFQADFKYLIISQSTPERKIWISKEDLTKVIKNDYDKKSKYIRALNEHESMQLESIIKYDTGEFIVNTNEEAKSIYYFELQNIGLDVEIDTIIATNKEVWNISKKRYVSLLEKFALRTENGTKATLHYTVVDNNKKDSIHLERKNGNLYILKEENKGNSYYNF